MNAPVSPPDFERRLSRRIEQHKGIMLQPAELQILRDSGALAVLAIEAADDGTDPVRPPTCATCDPFIYFMQAVSGGPVKIGYTTKPEHRRVAHQQSSHLEFQFIALFHAPQPYERALHQFYAPEHLRGEWFHPSRRLLRYAARMGVCSS